MNSKLTSKHSLKIKNGYVVWLENSNQYIVVSKLLLDILNIFYESNSLRDFSRRIEIRHKIPFSKARLYYIEMSELLNTPIIEHCNIKDHKLPLIPKMFIEEFYKFGNIQIKIIYGSAKLKALIHPQWIHANQPSSHYFSDVFFIFEEDDLIYLLKSQVFVGTYDTTEFHFLLGKFALQLINTLYDKIESDWIATFHASTVCNHEQAIMLIGDSGNGKSTLSAILMAHGIDVLADDFTPLSAENKEIHRYPSGISVKPGAFEMLKYLYNDFDTYPVFKSNSKNVNVKYIPPIKNMEEGPLHLPCTKIVYVKYDKTTSSNIQEIGIEKILETLIPESWISPLAKNSKLFLEWLKDLECYELNYSDNDFGVSSIKKLFD